MWALENDHFKQSKKQHPSLQFSAGMFVLSVGEGRIKHGNVSKKKEREKINRNWKN